MNVFHVCLLMPPPQPSAWIRRCPRTRRKGSGGYTHLARLDARVPALPPFYTDDSATVNDLSAGLAKGKSRSKPNAPPRSPLAPHAPRPATASRAAPRRPPSENKNWIGRRTRNALSYMKACSTSVHYCTLLHPPEPVIHIHLHTPCLVARMPAMPVRGEATTSGSVRFRISAISALAPLAQSYSTYCGAPTAKAIHLIFLFFCAISAPCK